MSKKKSKRSEMASASGNRNGGINNYSIERRTFDAANEMLAV